MGGERGRLKWGDDFGVVTGAECSRCELVHDRRHPYCYIQPVAPAAPTDDEDDDVDDPVRGKKKKKKRRQVRYVFYDIEASQRARLQLKSGEVVRRHEPILLVCAVLCAPCMDAGHTIDSPDRRPPSGKCLCGVFGPRFRYRQHQVDDGVRRKLAFHSFDRPTGNPVDDFLDFLLLTGPRCTTTVVLAHNGGKYDHHMLMERLFHRGITPRVVANGLKLYTVDVRADRRHIVLKDSLNFFSSPLADLHKTFDLGREGVAHKPYFPYLYIQRRYLNRPLKRLPPRRYYGARYMKPAKRAAFLTWYDGHKQEPFLLRDQLLLYCSNDVDILAYASVKFRAYLRSITTRIDPFLASSTIAGLSMKVFQAEFLRPNTVCNLPEGGINRRGRQSYSALRFFRTVEELLGWQIRTAEYSIGELPTPPDPQTGAVYRLDGWIRQDDGRELALEFYGCWAHGYFFSIVLFFIIRE